MAHKKGFVDYRLAGSKLSWQPGPKGAEVSVHSTPRGRADGRIGCVSLVLFMVGGWLGALWLIYIKGFQALRRRRCRGVLHIDEKGVRAKKTKLLRVKSLEWNTTDVLVLEPFTFLHRTLWQRIFQISGKPIPAYRLYAVPLEHLPDGEAGVNSAWLARRDSLSAAPVRGDGYSGPPRPHWRWLQSFLSLEFALQVAHRIESESGVALIDTTRAPKALVSTVEASAYDLESQGAVSLASQNDAGLISLAEPGDTDQPVLKVTDVQEPLPMVAMKPWRVRVTRKGLSSVIRIYRQRAATLFYALFSSGVLSICWGIFWERVINSYERHSALYDVVGFLGFLIPPIIFFVGLVWFLGWRYVVLRCDQDQVAILRSPEFSNQVWIPWDEIFAMNLDEGKRRGVLTCGLRIRTETQLVQLILPTDAGRWLLEELERWCSRAAWKKQRGIEQEAPVD
jgi:hypothetical protein